MPRQSFTVSVTLLTLFVVALQAARADHDSEKRRIYDKYEVVSFGPTQRLTDNIVRVGKVIAGGGTSKGSLEVYQQRYRELKSHWDDAEKKFKEHNVDTKNEPVYFDMIDWVQKHRPPTPPGAPPAPEVVTDHFVQFYVAARKKKRTKGEVTVTIENAETGRVLDYGDKESDRLQVYLEENNRSKFQKWVVPANWQSGEEVAIENAHMDYSLDYHDSKGPLWDEWGSYIQSTGDSPNKYQKWRFIPAGDDLVLIENTHSERVLDFHDSGDRKWRVYLEKRKGKQGNKFQRWKVRTVQ